MVIDVHVYSQLEAHVSVVQDDCQGIAVNVPETEIIVKDYRETYRGPYSVTPVIQDVILETKNLVMQDDVTVKRIPVYEVGNQAGGTTVIIGGEFNYGE